MDRGGGSSGYRRMGRDCGSAEEGGVEMTLLAAIDQTITATPSLWWLGGAGFVVRFASITFYVDPCFHEVPLDPSEVTNADMILATSAEYIDASTAVILDASKHAKGQGLSSPPLCHQPPKVDLLQPTLRLMETFLNQ